MVESKTEWWTIAIREIGRPRFIWQDVRGDAGKMKIQNCSKKAVDGEEWQRTAKQARTQKES